MDLSQSKSTSVPKNGIEPSLHPMSSTGGVLTCFPPSRSSVLAFAGGNLLSSARGYASKSRTVQFSPETDDSSSAILATIVRRGLAWPSFLRNGAASSKVPFEFYSIRTASEVSYRQVAHSQHFRCPHRQSLGPASNSLKVPETCREPRPYRGNLPVLDRTLRQHLAQLQ